MDTVLLSVSLLFNLCVSTPEVSCPHVLQSGTYTILRRGPVGNDALIERVCVDATGHCSEATLGYNVGLPAPALPQAPQVPQAETKASGPVWYGGPWR